MTEAPTETSKRAEFFAGEMASAPKAKTSKNTDRTFRLAIRDDDTEEDLFVYMMDHKDFWYNVDNTRIIASREQWEAKTGEILDAINDVETIEDFLLNNPDYGDKTTEELADDIKKPLFLREPIIISEDGVIWNGNRRLAIVRQLLKNEYEQRFERVPVCVLPHMEDHELKALEGRLQVKKTFKIEYGTIDVRLRVRQARNKNPPDAWDQIKSEFGGRWEKKELEKMLVEINYVDTYLNRIGKPKDYKYIRTKGTGKKKGIEIFITACAADEKLRQELMPENDIEKQDPVEYQKRQTSWFQQLSLPGATHDTVREYRDVMDNTTSRNDFFDNDQTYQNHASYTTTKVEVDGVKVEKSFHPDVLANANENRIAAAPTAAAGAKDPKTFAKKALKNLREINLQSIPKNNDDFKTVITDVERRINEIKNSENYN